MVCKCLKVSGKSYVFLRRITDLFLCFSHVEVFIILTGGLDLGVCDVRYLLKLQDNFKGFCSRQGIN